MKTTQLCYLLLVLFCSGCTHYSVVYPVCIYSDYEEADWDQFSSGVTEAIQTFYGDEADHLLSETRKTLVVSGTASQHEKFIPWWIVEGCFPSYGDSNERGVYVVCTAFLEQASNIALNYSKEKRKGANQSSSLAPYSQVLRHMDSKHLMCQHNRD